MGQATLFGSTPRIGEVEEHFAELGEPFLIGVDEAGRGPLAGPVVVAAVALPVEVLPALARLDDSKRLTEKARDALVPLIEEYALATALAFVGPELIDEINILQATFHGMRETVLGALAQLGERRPDRLVVDGKMAIPWPAGEPLAQSPIIKGDARSRNIAAASVLAKVARDRLMVELDAQYPVYGFARHKGYPTAAHRAALMEHGPSPVHRQSFKTVRESLDAQRASAS